MATLVLTAVGTALGGPLGGALGSLVGQSIDQGLFGPGFRKGPRLGDLSVQTSSYGSAIPRIYGTMRVAGTVIWATDLEEHEAIEGGGKSSPERVAYSYTANLAVALSSRPIKAVRRIWADGKLIRGLAGDFKVATKFRLYTGDQDQEIDPLIGPVETIALTPAYRGLALAVFEDLELAEFGNRIPSLTFEVEANEGEPLLSDILGDASGGLIEANDDQTIPGYAAYGASIGDGLRRLVELTGIQLAERAGKLRSPLASSPTVVETRELGCDAEGNVQPRFERNRPAESQLPTSLSMAYYDPDRDYQSGQMRASAGPVGVRHESLELPAVLAAGQAKALVEDALARRRRSASGLRLRLPPAHLALKPGSALQLPGFGHAWTVRAMSLEGMAVVIETEPAPTAVQHLPADGGRPVTETDVQIGRTALSLFELPALSDAPESTARAFAAASNDGRWRRVPAELAISANPLPGVSFDRRAVLGRTETALEPRCPLILDERSSVQVRISNSTQLLLNADHDALMAGVNLALVGDELIQFGRAEPLAPGLYRLSRLLRGRRGTEWAAGEHGVGELFWLMDAATSKPVDLPPTVIGAELVCTAHGVGDVAPLPEDRRTLTGEALRPPSPWHLTVTRSGPGLIIEWVRRSQRSWAWIDGVGDGSDSFPELYRLTVEGPGGLHEVQTDSRSILLALEQMPAQPGQTISISVVTDGPAALSRPAVTHLIL